MSRSNIADERYSLLFDVRRSVRYHDRRRAFFEKMHRVTNVLTVLMAGSVLFELGRGGDTSWWLKALSVAAALLAASDMVVGYASKADLHATLKRRFGDLEIAIVGGSNDEQALRQCLMERLRIEQDEPPVYRALDSLCHNEQVIAEGIDDPAQLNRLRRWERWTCHVHQWPNISETAVQRK